MKIPFNLHLIEHEKRNLAKLYECEASKLLTDSVTPEDISNYLRTLNKKPILNCFFNK
jgi:hypothetical protein